MRASKCSAHILLIEDVVERLADAIDHQLHRLHCLDVSEMRFVRLDSGLGTPQASIRSNVEFARTVDLH